ncbi:hypothetical protein MJG53_019031 [Ovis ammon polii x Ovis aries]|uniref:Uncharacterized protein n=1 Tax=Ovis ammon polii x Ovis aries TaxID=2918886 RepID=A0ACB9U3L7_9CETA|nr:hypothetical protein MJG53_019031 [Ovis ammon polii x Ovis aries]
MRVLTEGQTRKRSYHKDEKSAEEEDAGHFLSLTLLKYFMVFHKSSKLKHTFQNIFKEGFSLTPSSSFRRLRHSAVSSDLFFPLFLIVSKLPCHGCTAFLRLLGEYERNYKIALCGQAAVSLVWSFVLRSAGSPHSFCGLGYPVLDGRLAGSCVDQSGACQWQASQSTGEETPVMAGTHSTGQHCVQRVFPRILRLFGVPWCIRGAEVSSAHVHVPPPLSLLLNAEADTTVGSTKL